jgi:hypothetical protein
MNKKEIEILIKEITVLVDISENLARSFHHKVLELKERYRDEIDRYNQIVGMIEGQPLKINFEMTNKNGTWAVSIPGNPDFDNRIIPNEIVTRITNNALNPDIIQMVKDFETSDKRKFDFSFERHTKDYITGLITENEIQNEDEKEIPIEQARNTDTKTGDLKTFNTYLLNNEIFCHWMMSEFFEKWKPLIDNDCVTKTNER